MLIVKIVWFYLSEFGFRVGIPMCHALEPLFAIGIHARAHTYIYIYIYIYTHTTRLSMRCDDLQQYPCKLSTKIF
jgi:hypothetical protein